MIGSTSGALRSALRTDMRVWAGTLEVAGIQAKTPGSNGAHTVQFGLEANRMHPPKSVHIDMATGKISHRPLSA